MAQTEKVSGNQNREAQKKKNDNKRLSSWQNRIPPRWERKGKSGKTPETGMPRRAYLSTSQRRWPTRNFQKNQSWKKERIRKNGNGTYRDDGYRTCSVCKRVKQGNKRFPGKTKNSIIKGRLRLWRRGSEKREKHKKEEILWKNYQKNLEWRENTKGKTNIASRYPVKATIAHI